MAKKKFKLDLGKILTFAAAALALVAFFLMFAPAVGFKNADGTYTGAQLAFGYTKTAEVLGDTVSTKILVFSSYFIPYVLLVAGLVFSVLSALGILPKISKFISAGCYIAAGVLFFLAIQMSMPYIEDLKDISADLANKYKNEKIEAYRNSLKLAAGSIVSGILALLAGLTAASTIFIKK